MKVFLTLYAVLMSLGYIFGHNYSMSVVLQRCASYCNPEYCKIKKVCRPMNRTSKFFTMDIYYHPGVKLEAPLKYEVVTQKKFATVWRPHLIMLKGELCKELSLRTHPMFTLFGDKNRNTPNNFWEPCPMTGHRHTTPRITNLNHYASPHLPFVPAGEWKLDITFSQKRNGSEVVIVSWSEYYEIKSIQAEEF